MTGPLNGTRVVELAGLGPAPFAGMVLADLGADVVVVERPDATPFSDPRTDLLRRGKRSIVIDLKAPGAADIVSLLARSSDILLEGYRPGVAERLGIGPAQCLAANPSLVYGRMTGWGHDGPRADTAGHDIDYIALSGVLGSVGAEEEPVPPLNLVGDFGGGGMLLVVGVLAALTNARAGGGGQVVDAAMVDGSALLMTSHHGFAAEGWWSPERANNLLDGAAPFYTTYRTSDGEHMAVGALEPQFFARLLEGLGLQPDEVGSQHDRTGWEAMRVRFAEVFATESREHWTMRFAGTDACVAPVLDMKEAVEDAHNVARGTFVTIEGVVQPAPAPRFSRTPAHIDHPPPAPGAHTDSVLAGLGLSGEQIGKLRESGAVS